MSFLSTSYDSPNDSLSQVIILIGFMGAGKTTVGKLLSQYLRRPFVDLDEALEERLNLSIPEIFSQKGEDYFRDQETLLLEEFAHGQPRVLAAGGGVVVRPQNWPILKKVKTYYLKVPVTDLWARLQGPGQAHRPLAKDEEGFNARFQRRAASYEDCGQSVTATQKPQVVAQNIARLYLKQEDITLEVEGQTCRVRTAGPGEIPEFLENLKTKKLLVFLDRFFADETKKWASLRPETLTYLPKQKGELVKTLAEAEELLTFMAQNGLDRSDYLLAKGGGALTDLGAFCAGLYKRGLNLILWPTTLLGAVDAAIGGKTAVNLLGVKNQVGHFYLPKEVWLDPETLADLPLELLSEGLVEALKTGLLFDPYLYSLIAKEVDKILKGDLPWLLAVARRSAWAKGQLVARDFREVSGQRDFLNLGHTYGHVLESYHGSKLSHGRAVAMGLAVALEVSLKGGLDPALAQEAMALCHKLAGHFPPLPPKSEAKRLLSFDKKIRAGGLKFVVLNNIEDPELIRDFDPDLILDAADRVYQAFEGSASF